MTDWIEWKWTEEKPYPETLETLVYVRWGNGEEDEKSHPVSYSIYKDTNCFEPYNVPGLMITHYKLAEPAND